MRQGLGETSSILHHRVNRLPMGPAFIFQITDLTKKFGQRELLKNINLAF